MVHKKLRKKRRPGTDYCHNPIQVKDYCLMNEYYHKPAAASPQSLLRARLVMAEGGSSWRMCEGWNPAGCLNWQDLNTYNDHFLLNKILMILIIIVKS